MLAHKIAPVGITLSLLNLFHAVHDVLARAMRTVEPVPCHAGLHDQRVAREVGEFGMSHAAPPFRLPKISALRRAYSMANSA